MSDGLSSDRQDAITNAELFTISPYHIIVCIGVGRRIDHMELIQLASRDHLGEYGPLVFPSTTQDARNMIAKLTMRKTCIGTSVMIEQTHVPNTNFKVYLKCKYSSN